MFCASKAWVVVFFALISLLIGVVLSGTRFAELYRYYPYALFGVLLMCYIVALYFYRTKNERVIVEVPTRTVDEHSSKKIFVYAIALSAIIVYLGVAVILYSAWMKNDEFAFAYRYPTYMEQIRCIFFRYTGFVSRIGDLFIHACPLDASRWQVFMLTPLVPAVIPFVLHRLVSRSNETMFTFSGLCFYWAAVALCLMCVYMSSWRSYWCYAANANYLWPSALMVLFLSFYNKSRWNASSDSSVISSVALFILGVVVAWGQECLTVVLLPLLTLWIVYHIYKKIYIPNACFWGFIGCKIGAFLLFAAPALRCRALGEATCRKIDVAALSNHELGEFLSNLDWDKVNLLRGPSNVVNFHGIPFFDRVYFLPFLLDRYAECCVIVLCAFTMLFLLFLGVTRKSVEVSKIVPPVFFALCSLLCALTYSVSCIPGHWSFTVSGVLLLVSCSFLMHEIRRARFGAYILCGVATVFVAYALSVFVPAGVEAVSLKKYEYARSAEIIRQRDSGVKHIKLNYPLPKKPKDPLGLIGADYMKETPTSYDNKVASQFYHVESITQKAYENR